MINLERLYKTIKYVSDTKRKNGSYEKNYFRGIVR